MRVNAFALLYWQTLRCSAKGKQLNVEEEIGVGRHEAREALAAVRLVRGHEHLGSLLHAQPLDAFIEPGDDLLRSKLELEGLVAVA